MQNAKSTFSRDDLGKNFKKSFKNQKRLIIDDCIYKMGDLFNQSNWKRSNNLVQGKFNMACKITQKLAGEQATTKPQLTKETSLLRKTSLLEKIMEKQNKKSESSITEGDESVFSEESSSFNSGG